MVAPSFQRHADVANQIFRLVDAQNNRPTMMIFELGCYTESILLLTCKHNLQTYDNREIVNNLHHKFKKCGGKIESGRQENDILKTCIELPYPRYIISNLITHI